MALDTTVKIFSSTQLGAPTLNNTAGSLIAVIDACCVNGFGLKTCDSITVASGVGTANISTGHSMIEQGVALFAGATGSYSGLNGERKVLSSGTSSFTFDASGLADGTVTGTVTAKVAGAGWVKAFAGTNLAAYKSGNVAATGHYLRVDDTTTTYATVRGYEAMTDVNTGSGIFPTVAQQATNVWNKSDSATARPWFVIANDKFLYFGSSYSGSYTTTLAIYCFGDAVPRKAGDAYRSVLFAAKTTSPTPSTSSSSSPVTTSAAGSCTYYSPRGYTALSSPAALTHTWFDRLNQSGYQSGYNGSTFPNPEDNGIFVTPMLTMEGTTYRGELPGVLATPQNIQAGIADDTRIANVSGYNRTLVYKQSLNNSGNTGGVFFDVTGPWNG